jgi:hypothetical protein
MLDKLQKELKATQELSAVKAQEAQNAIKGLQLAGQISEKDTQRLQKLAELRDVTDQLAKKQEALSKIKAIDASDTEEVRKLASEIASLQGKQIDIQLNIRRDEFDKQIEALGKTTQRRLELFTLEGTVSQNNLNIAQARNSLETARLEFQRQELELGKENAATDSDRLRIIESLDGIKRQQIENEYRMTLANIDNTLRQAQIETAKVRLKELELQITVQLARAQGMLTEAHREALIVAQAATRLAVENLQTAETVAGYQRETAKWTRNTEIAAANAALQAERTAVGTARTARSTAEAAENTGKMADNMKRAAGVTLQGFSTLEPWMEQRIAAAKQAAIASAGGNSYKGYIAGINAELELRNKFNSIISAQRNQSNSQAEIEFWTNAAKLGFGKFASGGYVTGPTLGLIGEGGESEYVIPQSRMFEATSRFMAGARGPAVLSGGASSTTSQTAINITTGPVLEFNGERYVTLRDMERAMRVTAEGVIGRLRTPSARVALGMV